LSILSIEVENKATEIQFLVLIFIYILLSSYKLRSKEYEIEISYGSNR